MYKLTHKQELFTQNLFKGLTQRESWIQAGYSDRYAVSWIDSHACNLANLAKIKTRLAELHAPIVERITKTKEAKLDILEKIYSHEPLPEDITARDRVTAIKEHNLMQGVYAESPAGFQDNRVINFIISGEKELIEGITKRLRAPQDVVEGEVISGE